jgi:Ni/Co efflux regulator RcnB
MRKLIFGGLMAALIVPAAASGQTNELRKDERKVERQDQELQRAVQGGDPRDIEAQARDARKARQELREDRDDFARNRYVAPYDGWSYSALTPGTRLRSGFYDTRYGVAHPDGYRLRHANRNQRWVRYGDDLVLVNVRSGRVLEVATGRF